MAERARLTLDIDPALHKKLKKLAAEEGVTVRQLCLQAIGQRLIQAPGDRVALPLEPDEVLTELWDNEDDAIYDDF